jgi:hypothetical protein
VTVYASLIEMAQRLIAEKGAVFSYHAVNPGAPPDSGKPWIPGATVETVYDIEAVMFPLDRISQETTRRDGDASARRGNAQVFLGQQSFVPQIDDYLLLDGVKRPLRSVKTIAPDLTNILHILEIDL